MTTSSKNTSYSVIAIIIAKNTTNHSIITDITTFSAIYTTNNVIITRLVVKIMASLGLKGKV